MPILVPKTIECCHHCVPPKRHTACWDHCPEYKKEREAFEERKKKDRIKAGLDAHRTKVVARVMKGKWR